MTEEDFIATMRVEFRVWEGTKHGDDILTDVVAIHVTSTRAAWTCVG